MKRYILGAEKCSPTDEDIYDYQVETLDGHSGFLAAYKGKVVLIVNVATYCGYTNQYWDMNKLLDKYSDDGLAILAFPCNQFGAQEPAKNEALLAGLTTALGIWGIQT